MCVAHHPHVILTLSVKGTRPYRSHMLYFCKDPEIHPILQTQLDGSKPKKAGVFQASWCYKPEGAQAGRLVAPSSPRQKEPSLTPLQLRRWRRQIHYPSTTSNHPISICMKNVNSYWWFSLLPYIRPVTNCERICVSFDAALSLIRTKILKGEYL